MPCGCRARVTDCTRLTAHCAACDCVILKVETQSVGRQQHVAPVITSSQQPRTDMEQGGRSQLAHLFLSFFPDPFRQHPAIYHTWFSVFPEHNEPRTTQVRTLINFAAGLDFTLTVGGATWKVILSSCHADAVSGLQT